MKSWTDTLTPQELATVTLVIGGEDQTFMYRDVSMGMLSIARYSGGATVGGHRYKYLPEFDELVRGDVLKSIEALRKLERKKAREENKAAQGALL